MFSSARTLALKSAKRAASSWLMVDSRVFPAASSFAPRRTKCSYTRVDQPHLIGLETRVGSELVDGFDPLEQSGIEEDGVGGGSQLRLPLTFELLVRRVGDVLARHGEHASDAVERAARALHGGKRVLECRRIRIGDDRVDLGALFRQRGFECSGKCSGRI